jgi:hypothetical protein
MGRNPWNLRAGRHSIEHFLLDTVTNFSRHFVGPFFPQQPDCKLAKTFVLDVLN